MHHYDVQSELVGHLANAIEEKKAADKTVAFETALAGVHAGFGILGFAGVVNSRSRALNRQYTKMRRKLFYSYVQWPKAALTACLLSSFVFVGKFLSGEVLYYMMCVIFFFVYVFDLYAVSSAARNIKKQKHKLLLTEISFSRLFWLFPAGGFPSGMIRFDDFPDGKTYVFYTGYVIFIFLAVAFFFSTVSYRQMLARTQEMARKEYPEAFA